MLQINGKYLQWLTSQRQCQKFVEIEIYFKEYEISFSSIEIFLFNEKYCCVIRSDGFYNIL